MNSQYSKIHINLLPPELRPGPAVRYTVMVNIALVAATVAFVLVSTVSGLSRMASLKRELQDKEATFAALQPYLRDYQNILGVQDSVNKFGRVIGLVSREYVEMPLLMDRVSRILPEGVYLKAVTNDRPQDNTNTALMRFQLAASKRSPGLVDATLRSFKSDSFFNNCYLRTADYKQEGLEDRLQQFGVNWSVTGGENEGSVLADQIEFEIQALVARPLETAGTGRGFDESSYISDIEFLTPAPPPAEEDTAKPGQPRRIQ